MKDVSKALRILQRIRHTDYYLKYDGERAWWYDIKLSIDYSKSLLEKLINCFLEHNRPLLALFLVNTHTSIAQVRSHDLDALPSYRVALESGRLLEQVNPVMYSQFNLVLSWVYYDDELMLYLKVAEKYLQFDHNKSTLLLLYILARFQFHVISIISYRIEIEDDVFHRIESLMAQLTDTEMKEKVHKLWRKTVYHYQAESYF